MPFTQMMLFPTEFKLITTGDGLRMVATPIQEIDVLHGKQHVWTSLTAADADRKLHTIPPGPLQVNMEASLPPNDEVTLQYQGSDLVTLHTADLNGEPGSVEILIAKAVAEIFINGGLRYSVRKPPADQNLTGLNVHSEETAKMFNRIEACELKLMWPGKA